MNAEDLYEEWTEGESSGVRPARVQELRAELREYTGLYVPRSRSDIENWLPAMKGQVTRKLREAAEESAGEEPEQSDDDEDEGEVDDAAE